MGKQIAPYQYMRKLYSDGEQLHQYIKKENNHIWPQVIEHKKTMKQMALEIQVQIWTGTQLL